MAAASVARGTPVGQVRRSRARSSSRKMMRATIATATDPNRAPARLSPYIRKHINVQLGIADPSCVKRAAGGEDA